jgi:hypothetical protein
MSEKKAKEKRREEKEREEKAMEGPELIGTMSIDVYENLDVKVRNFPSDHNIAMIILCNAIMKVSAHFLEDLKINSKSNLVLARPGASPADIIKMAAGN